MTLVEIGHTIGIRQSPSGETVPTPKKAELVTAFHFAEDTQTVRAFSSVVNALPAHMPVNHKPSWVKATDPELQKLLLEHFDITPRQNNRPSKWGKREVS